MVLTAPQTRVDILYSDDFANIFAKLENTNPTGSIKYRVARHLLDVAERRDGVQPGHNKIIETSNGNTGIALAYLGRKRGYPTTIVVPKNCTQQSQALMRNNGATVIAADGYMAACEDVIRGLMDSDREFYWPRQFYNKESVSSSRNLGREILEEVRVVDYFLACTGTCATITGVGGVLKERNPGTRVIAVVPAEDWDIPGLDDYRTYEAPLLQSGIVDDTFVVKDRAFVEQAKRKLLGMGHDVGFSSAAAYHAAQSLLETVVGGNIVILFPDSGNRYGE